MSDTYVASNYEEADILATEILNNKSIVLGFDTETTIGRCIDSNMTSIVQLSTNDKCYIFQIYRIFCETRKLPKSFIKILRSTNIVKIGTDITNDLINLNSYQISVNRIIDVQCIAITMGIVDIGLDALCNKLLPDISNKKYKLDHKWNWDLELTIDQINYAATDAYLSLLIYKQLIKGVDIETPDNIIDNDDYNNYYNWIKNALINQSTTVDKLVNRTVNSYGFWAKKYTQSKRFTYSRELINKFIVDKLLTLDVNGKLTITI